MQRSCLFLSSPTSFSPVSLLLNSSQVVLTLRNPSRSSITSTCWTKLPFNCSVSSRLAFSPLHSTAVEEIVETSTEESEFIEVGYICKLHGIQGELRVKPNTDFPELRFGQPGKRWLKEKYLGKDIIREVELIEGRDHPGQKSWIVSFSGIDTVDQAKELVGSTLLVRKEDRPVLEEGEFYTRDLVGMKVILKDTGKLVGTVINVFNSGGPNDLLQVKIYSNEETDDGTGSESGTDVSGHLAWVPFVEAIVPDVDMHTREMRITPPNGLLELNRRSDTRSKKERRQLEWRERKKATRCLIVAKKRLCEMERKHIFHGLQFGEKAERTLLADHIVSINFKLFQQAMHNFETVSTRWNLSEFVKAYPTNILENPIKIPKESLASSETKDKTVATEGLKRKGQKLISEGKAAIVLVVNDKKNLERCSNLEHGDSGSADSSNIAYLQASLLNDGVEMEEKNRGLLPLIMVTSSHEKPSVQNSFLDNDYFSFDSDKVWFLEEENLPIVSSSADEQNKHKVLMKSPWEILQSPVGSGGIFSLLSSHNILENLSEKGVEYVQVCSLGEGSVVGNPLFFGYVKSRKADIGIEICNSNANSSEDFNVIFSMKILKKILKQIDKLKFHAVTKQNSHVQLVDKDWVDVVPSTLNSYEYHCSIYSSLSVCSPDKICAMEVTN
ncbi:Ribosome maturation factor rimm [Thalictrum thalictroides]|uniref:Ribosome maturation factor rimm n=1 Tax=Thalictrum thalictroides TaxID=46969 RepID=A0A7J6W3X9_THATH|nr:Ribosome maturation factor rimm [Thalictrum thalictroides]